MDGYEFLGLNSTLLCARLLNLSRWGSVHKNLRAETAAFTRAEEARGGDMNGVRVRDGSRRFRLPIVKNINCDTLVLVGVCPDRAEGTIRGLHPWTRFLARYQLNTGSSVGKTSGR